MNTILVYIAEYNLKHCVCLLLLPEKIWKVKMSPVTVRHDCVVCGIQWFNGKFKRGNKACVRKIKVNDGRLKKKKDSETQTEWLSRRGKKERRRETKRWLMEPKSRFLASSDLHYSAISRHTHSRTPCNQHTYTLSASLSALVCNQHTSYWSAIVINNTHCIHIEYTHTHCR